MIPTDDSPPPPDELLAALRAHGDRTSSLALLGQHFSTHRPASAPGLVRFLELPAARVAAAEPLVPAEFRAEALADLAAASPGLRVLAMPVGARLASELRSRGFSAWQIGSEPVFRLAEYFSRDCDPLLRHPLARALSRRGAELRELRLDSDDGGQRAELEALTAAWLADRGCAPLGFLSHVAPFAAQECKRYFTLHVRGRLQAFVAAAPVRSEGEVLGWYLQDMPRRADARAGAVDLLLMEVMRLLHAEGAAEVRLGMAPLFGLDPEGAGAGLLSMLHRRWRWGYCFRSLSEFKAKFAPSAWEPLYLASTSPSLALALYDALRAHFPAGMLRPAIDLAAEAGGLSVRPEALPVLAYPPSERIPATAGELFRRTGLTCLLVLFFTGLHLGRQHWPALQALFARSGYVPGAVTWEGTLLGPLFHNHWFHLTGDQLSFLLFGALIEALLGLGPYVLLLGAGLWLSNPLTQLTCWALLSWSAPQAWAATLAEVDYGSSNAVFAMAGALSALLRQWRSVLAPFAAYGLFICFARASWLALHHLLTLALGYAVIRLWMVRAGRSPGP